MNNFHNHKQLSDVNQLYVKYNSRLGSISREKPLNNSRIELIRPRCLDLVEQPRLDRFVNELSPQTRAVNARKNTRGEEGGERKGKEREKKTMVGAWRKNTFNGVGSLRSPLEDR